MADGSTGRDGSVVVVGGGLAGLTAAARLARAGVRVTVLEGAAEIGGRARVRRKSGFTFNLGPHALYRHGAARGLARLGVRLPGRAPPSAGSLAVVEGALHPLPTSPVSLLADRRLSLRGKLQVGRFFAFVLGADLGALARRTIADVLAERASDGGAHAYLSSLLRVSTYGNANEQASADAALRQLKSALTGGVLYLDGGWWTLLEQLRAVLERSGGEVLTRARVVSLERRAPGRFTLELRDGRCLPADEVIVALPMEQASKLLGTAGIDAVDPAAAVHARAACLTLGLSSLPRPERFFALGLDEPSYLSLHSLSAKLAPDGGALIHSAWYLPATGGPSDLERLLEERLDLVQPGWRDVVVERWWLPDLVVAPLPLASAGGLQGRPTVVVPGEPGLFLAGDYVGPKGILADASVHSALCAAEHVLARAHRREAA